MIPLSDINPSRRSPLLTYTLIGLNVLVFVWQLFLSQEELARLFLEYSVVPRLISASPFSAASLLDGLRSMFFHGGFWHLGSNMLYLWVFGDNIEDRLGKVGFLVAYFASGYAAIAAQVAFDPDSGVPLVGASGAIAGVLGAYLVQYPRARVRSVVVIGFFYFVEIPAYIVLGLWFIVQLFNGAASLGVETATGGGVAFFAHIGGFVFGMLFMLAYNAVVPQPVTRRVRQRPPVARRRESLGLPPLITEEEGASAPQSESGAAMHRSQIFRELMLRQGRQASVATITDVIEGRIADITPTEVVLIDAGGRRWRIPLTEIVAVD